MRLHLKNDVINVYVSSLTLDFLNHLFILLLLVSLGYVLSSYCRDLLPEVAIEEKVGKVGIAIKRLLDLTKELGANDTT
jgi:hypothetical protein